jgi:glycine betaine/proline transport system ATP-binding protein
MEKIQVKNLTKIFGCSPERGLALLEQGYSKERIMQEARLGVGVDRASFEVEEGEIVVVMGLSGSGKSTLVRCINRLIEPTHGRIFLDGQDITALSRKELRMVRQKKMGMVFQHFALFPHRSVLQNAEYGLEIQGVAPSIRREQAMAALEQVGLKGWEDSLPAQLSGGMQQRVGLARALALDPDVLLMDEAFSALDPLIRRDMQDELIGLQEKVRKTILFISHDLDEALKLGDRIVLMKDGAIVQVGTPEEILTSPADEYVARFVEDVDITKVLTAGTVMEKCRAVVHLKTDGPRAALRKMKKSSISSIFVLDKEHRLMGVITAEDAARLAESGERDLEKIIIRDIRTVPPETPAKELFQHMHGISYPLAVVNGDDHLQGVIVKGGLLAAIYERGAAA